ncbi:MAG TPA: hypothetical protein VIY49_11760 [Bryobacteraceae bacterium]
MIRRSGYARPAISVTSQDHLQDRVVRAAEAALSDHSYVSAIDVLCGGSDDQQNATVVAMASLRIKEAAG